MYVVVCYDVVADRKRTRLHKALKGFLEHVQKSVFEGELEADRCHKMKQRMQSIIDCEIDTVRVYTLCKGCRPRIEIIGTGALPDSEPDVVV